MCEKKSIMVKEINDSKLLAFFNTLEERDKDIIITMSEFLFEKWKNKKLNNIEKEHNQFIA